MKLFKVCWRGSPLKRLAIGGVSMFICCWVIVLLLSSSPETSSNQKETSVNSLNVPREPIYLKKGRSSKQSNAPEDSRLKKPSHVANVPGKSLLSTATRSNKTINKPHLKTPSLNKTNSKPQLKTNPSLLEVVAKIDSLPSLNGPDSLQLLKKKLDTLNEQERILNSEKFPPLQNNDIVLIVQVHKRVGYLRQLLDSLKAARGIDRVLLVISHDYYYDEMNELVASIDFCKVLQIFYPFSLQVFPDVFPGQSKNDCPRDISKDNAIKMNCTNALHPDSFGHYREAPVTAIKHHWWWKANTVFDHLRATTNFNGYVFFLEEDHYASPDMVHVAKKLIALKEESCPDCDFVNLGTYHTSSFSTTGTHVVKISWNAGQNNMGFGMNRATWNTIKGCSQKFCEYDDYNWDWSLNSLGDSCLQRKITVLIMKAARIMHIGTCGTHHHKSCNEANQGQVAKDKFARETAHLFPDSLQFISSMKRSVGARLNNYGGWGDTRDHSLCMSFVKT